MINKNCMCRNVIITVHDDCLKKCANCDKILCSNCSKKCEHCGTFYCQFDECFVCLVKCHVCDKDLCSFTENFHKKPILFDNDDDLIDVVLNNQESTKFINTCSDCITSCENCNELIPNYQQYECSKCHGVFCSSDECRKIVEYSENNICQECLYETCSSSDCQEKVRIDKIHKCGHCDEKVCTNCSIPCHCDKDDCTGHLCKECNKDGVIQANKRQKLSLTDIIANFI